MTGYYFSAFLVVVESISILCLIFLAVHHEDDPAPPWAIRFGMLGMMVGLGIHVIGQVELLLDYRPPRSWTWVPLQLSTNWTVQAYYLNKALPRWRRHWARMIKA